MVFPEKLNLNEASCICHFDSIMTSIKKNLHLSAGRFPATFVQQKHHLESREKFNKKIQVQVQVISCLFSHPKKRNPGG